MMESPIAPTPETNSTIKPDPNSKPDLPPVNTENNNGEITDSTTTPTPNRSKKSVRWSVDLVEERTLPPLDKTNADADYNNNNRYVIRSIESDSSSQSFNINNSMVNIKDTFGRWRKKVGEATKKAEDLAGNTWQHLKTAPSLTDGALGRIAQGTKVLAEGGYEKIFRQTFETVPEESLQNSYACYLSTSAGPVLGVLYVSTAKLAFCSDNPLSYKNVDKTEWSYYKMYLPPLPADQVKSSTEFEFEGEGSPTARGRGRGGRRRGRGWASAPLGNGYAPDEYGDGPGGFPCTAQAKNRHTNSQGRWPAKSSKLILDFLKNTEET